MSDDYAIRSRDPRRLVLDAAERRESVWLTREQVSDLARDPAFTTESVLRQRDYDKRMAYESRHSPTPEGAKVESIPSFKELERLREKKDDEFLAWVADIPDKHWSRYDLSAVRLGYEFGRKIERRATELAGGG